MFFVDHTIQQLRVAGELIPLWAASRVVQDLCDLQRVMPLRFMQLARCKAASDDYWGFHAANVAVLDYVAARDRFRAAQDWVRQAGPGTRVDHYEASIIDTRAREVEAKAKEQLADKDKPLQ